MEKNKYRVIGHGSVKDEDRYYEAGDIMLLSIDQATPLLAIGKVELVAADTVAVTTQQTVAAPDGFPAHEATPPPAAAPTPPAPQATPQPEQDEQVPPQAPVNIPTPEAIAVDAAQAK